MTQEFDAELVNKVMKKMQAVQELFDTEARDLTNAALSVIAPHYEKQIAELRAQIPHWNDDMDASIVGQKILLYCPPRGITNLERVEVDYYDNGNGSIHAWATHWMHIPRPPESPLSPPKTAESEE